MIDPHLHAMLCRNAALYPNRPALEFEGQVVTHLALLQQASRIAQAYHQAGVQRGDRIAILSRNTAEMVLALSACELSGRIAVPLNHRLATPELSLIAQDCTPKLLLVDAEFIDVGRAMIEQVQHDMSLWVMGGTVDQVPNLAQLIQGDACPLPEPPRTQDTACIIYTSGSTGRPKGVMLSHQGMVESGRVLAAPAVVRPDSRQLVIMPLFHVGAAAHRMAYMVHGGTMVLQRKFDAAQVLLELSTGRITDIHLAPTMLRSLLDEIGDRPITFDQLECVKYASSPIPDDTLARAIKLFGSKLIQFYALTESGAIATVLHRYVHAEAAQGIGVHRLRSAGQPHLGCQMQIRDRDGRVCPPGVEGEIWLRSAAMMTGYWNNPDLTRDNLVEGWLRTGDVARFDDENYLFILDRMKDMVVSGGENIYSSEVERTLDSHPDVLESAVIGIPDPHWGEAVHAFVVLRPGAINPGADNLIEYCKQRLASYKKPKSIEFMPTLPRLQHVQKIDKPTLRKPFWGDNQRGVN